MTPMEIALLVIGVIIFVLSFLLPDKSVKKTKEQLEAEQEDIRNLMQQELDGMKYKVSEAANETVDGAVEKAERDLEKCSNEKIMAVNEYGQTILEEINKNHQEVMFLYDMIKDKHTDLTNAVREADDKFAQMESLSKKASEASEGLRRELNVISVTKKGLSPEQRAIFDEPSQPADIKPVAAQSYANQVNAAAILNAQAKKEVYVATDVMSGTPYKKDAGNATITPVVAPPKAPTANPAPSVNPAISKNGVNKTNSNQRILELHNQGMATVDIAKELKLGVGEVKLVLDLFQ